MNIKAENLKLGGRMVCKSMNPTSEPAGAYWTNPDVLKFIRGGKNLSLELKTEPKNRYDSNAIKIIGVVHGWVFKSRYHIGYVPAEE